jgi:hypothetical protein
LHFFALYQQIYQKAMSMHRFSLIFSNEIKDLGTHLTVNQSEITFKMKHLAHVVKVKHEAWPLLGTTGHYPLSRQRAATPGRLGFALA